MRVRVVRSTDQDPTTAQFVHIEELRSNSGREHWVQVARLSVPRSGVVMYAAPLEARIRAWALVGGWATPLSAPTAVTNGVVEIELTADSGAIRHVRLLTADSDVPVVGADLALAGVPITLGEPSDDEGELEVSAIPEHLLGQVSLMVGQEAVAAPLSVRTEPPVTLLFFHEGAASKATTVLVKDTSGAPIQGAFVGWSMTIGALHGPRSQTDERGRAVGYARSTSVIVVAPGYVPRVVPLESAHGGGHLEVELRRTEDRIVTVVDHDGRPVPSAGVYLNSSETPSTVAHLCDSEGTCRVWLDPSWSLFASDPRTGASASLSPLPEAGPIEIQLREAKQQRVQVRVVDARGAPYLGPVALTQVGGLEEPRVMGDGQFEVAARQGAVLSIYATADDGRLFGSYSGRASGVPIEVRLSPPLQVRITFEGGPTEGPVEVRGKLRRDARHARLNTSWESGRLVVSVPEAGYWDLRVHYEDRVCDFYYVNVTAEQPTVDIHGSLRFHGRLELILDQKVGASSRCKLTVVRHTDDGNGALHTHREVRSAVQQDNGAVVVEELAPGRCSVVCVGADAQGHWISAIEDIMIRPQGDTRASLWTERLHRLRIESSAGAGTLANLASLRLAPIGTASWLTDAVEIRAAEVTPGAWEIFAWPGDFALADEEGVPVYRGSVEGLGIDPVLRLEPAGGR